MALKWGVASAGLIANDFINALGTQRKDHHQVVAVAASSDVSRAQELADRFNVPRAYGSYLELAKDPEVEVVHLGMLDKQHFEVALMMLDHGKHVLVEKPMCMNSKQVHKLTSYAKEKKLFAMEGIWSRMFPCYQYIRNQIESGKLGDVTSVEIEFGNGDMSKAQRFIKKDLGGGATLELGVYPIQFFQWIFQQEPKSIKATGVLNEEGIDLEVDAEITYGPNKVGKMKATSLVTPSRTAKIIGTKGTMTVPSFWAPLSIIDVDGSEKKFAALPEAKHKFFYMNSCGLIYEADEVRKCIRAGKLECDFVTHNDSLTISRIQDEIRKQVGVKYPEDD